MRKKCYDPFRALALLIIYIRKLYQNKKRGKMKILMIDNFDSFTYNLVELFKLCGAEVEIIYNNVHPRDINISQYDLLCLSPGPSHPTNSGYLMQYIDYFFLDIPIFGVCLGFQALVHAFGGKLNYLDHPVHGRSSSIDCKTDSVLFSNLEATIEVARYHSIIAEEVNDEFTVSATYKSIPMAIEHNNLPIYGVQFHPESILSMKKNIGRQIIENLFQKILEKKDKQRLSA
jgi:anthranilate synthase/aminodeoxychorismate synthase-like glutamine amidotransferase